MSLEDLPEGDVTVAVEASTMNYKDGLAMQPNGGGVIQKYPMVPGIDLSGTVSESSDPRFQKGDRVVLNGYGASETKWGGYSSVWRGSGKDLVKIPANLSTEQAMMIGTGGYTSMLSVLALEKGGVTPESDGEILVTGACGGVGSVAIAILSKLGYKVCALTGRAAKERPFLESLGASRVITREDLIGDGKKKMPPLGKEQFAGAIDSVGGPILAQAVAATKYRGVVAACGIAGGNDLGGLTVLPFVLRGVQLVGIDSVQAPMANREEAWRRLGEDLDLNKLSLIAASNPRVSLDEVPRAAQSILAGEIRGRVLVLPSSPPSSPASRL